MALLFAKYFKDFEDTTSPYPNATSTESNGSWKKATLKEKHHPKEGVVGQEYIVFLYSGLDKDGEAYVDAPEPPFHNGNGIDPK